MDNNTLPAQDDMLESGPGSQDLLDAVLANNSDFSQLLGGPLPQEDDDPDMVSEDFSNNEDPEDEHEFENEAVSDEDVEVDYDDELDEDADDEDATQDTNTFELEDLDMGAHVNVKVDGETMPVSFSDLVKGYQTNAHLSNQGRELGEARKAFEEEKSTRMAEIETMNEMSAAVVLGAEKAKANEYNEAKAKLAKLKEEGADRFETADVRERMQELAEEFHSIKARREELVSKFEQQKEKKAQEDWESNMEEFHASIPEMIPEWSEDHAMKIRDFALSEGVSEDMLSSINSPVVVKVLSDYMKLKMATTKGSAKRKAPAAAKGLPTRRTKTSNEARKAASVRQRALSSEASKADQLSYLANLSGDLFK